MWIMYFVSTAYTQDLFTGRNETLTLNLKFSINMSLLVLLWAQSNLKLNLLFSLYILFRMFLLLSLRVKRLLNQGHNHSSSLLGTIH